MTRTKLNFLVDAAGFTGFVLLATTGVLVRYVLPPGSGKHSLVWGLNRHEWGAIHFWVSVAFLAALAVHVALHWRWVVAVVRGRTTDASGVRLGLGVVGLLAGVGLAAAPLTSSVERGGRESAPHGTPVSESGPRDRDRGEADAPEIRGFTTLREVATATGVPAAYILGEIGLPPDTDLDERLGPLGREHGFRPERVRQIVREYRREPEGP